MREAGFLGEQSINNDLPSRVVVGANGAYWRDFGSHYSMCPVSDDNDPVDVVEVYVRSDVIARVVEAAVKTAVACAGSSAEDTRE